MAKKNAQPLHLPIIIEQDEDNVYIVSCPSFKGCHSFGNTIDEAIKNITEVIEMCIDEQKNMPVNNFVGFREILVTA